MNTPGPFRTRLHLRWADIDANFHLRHGVYYDLCAQQRMEALTGMGITLSVMKEHGFGPVLFREECVFRREIKLEDEVWSELRLRHLGRDHDRFSFEHVLSRADGTWCATLVVEGAWYGHPPAQALHAACGGRRGPGPHPAQPGVQVAGAEIARH